MPTRDVLASYGRDWDKLTPQQQRAFREAVAQFIADLVNGGQGFHPPHIVTILGRTSSYSPVSTVGALDAGVVAFGARMHR